MDKWFQSRYEDNENNSVQFPECLMCTTQISQTTRYSKIIKQQLELLEKIKLKHYGDLDHNKKLQVDLIKEKNASVKRIC